MGETPRAPYGRPRREIPESGLVTMKVRIPARLARLMYAQSDIERRQLATIYTEALSEYYRRHPPESWSSMT